MVIIHSHNVNQFQREDGINFGNLKTKFMIYFIIGIIGTFFWMVYEFYRAPMMDENGRVTKEGKKLKDLFKKIKSK
jgi:Tfp pilus assembly protein PilO